MKSGNLNFLEPSGPLQACNGADCFTFYFETSGLVLIFLNEATSSFLYTNCHLQLNRNFLISLSKREMVSAPHKVSVSHSLLT
jgi:hypothetical protein